MPRRPLILLLGAVSIIQGCSNPTATAQSIHLIIPDSFRGKIEIRRDQTNGQDIPIQNGIATIQIPQSGRLALKSLDLFHATHQEQFTTASGQNLTSRNNSAADHSVQVFDLGYGFDATKVKSRVDVNSFMTVRYFVGTPKEFARAKSEEPKPQLAPGY